MALSSILPGSPNTALSLIVLLTIGHIVLIVWDMMTKIEILNCLNSLDITQNDAAKLLSVSPRTFRRWVANPSEMPGPAEQALRAWVRLNDENLVWRPDCQEIYEDDPKKMSESIVRLRKHMRGLESVLRKVEGRGGPAAMWNVDLDKRKATWGPFTVNFWELKGGSFSPHSYRRSDPIHPNRERDWALLEDAYYCFAKAVGKAGENWGEKEKSTPP